MASDLIRSYTVVAWWGTCVEVRSAIERLMREGRIDAREREVGLAQFTVLRARWQEIQSNHTLRLEAEHLLGSYPLKASDALQLAAALTWASGQPQQYTFISGDTQLLRAAHQSGFQTIRT